MPPALPSLSSAGEEGGRQAPGGGGGRGGREGALLAAADVSVCGRPAEAHGRHLLRSPKDANQLRQALPGLVQQASSRRH